MGMEWDCLLGEGPDSPLIHLVDYHREEGLGQGLNSLLTLPVDSHPEADLGEDLNSRLTRLVDYHLEADLGQGYQSYQGHQDRRQEEEAEGGHQKGW